MKLKNSGLTASGQTQPEISNSQIADYSVPSGFIGNISMGKYFVLATNKQAVRFNIARGVKDMCRLIDGFTLAALKVTPSQLLSKCVNDTDDGCEIWQSIVSRIGAALTGKEGNVHA